jgi:hypothetical protein
MRDINRIHQICTALEAAWMKSPDMRLGQLLENCVFPSTILYQKSGAAIGCCVLFFQEDDVTLQKLEELGK